VVPPEAPAASPPLLCREFHEWLFARLTQHGPVTPTDKGHPAHGRLIKAAKDGFAIRGANVGVNLPADVAWLRLAYALEHVVRRCAVDADTALALLQPLGGTAEDVRRVAQSGISPPGQVRDQIIADFDAEEALYRAEADRAAAAKARETELVPYDIAADGLCVVKTSVPLFGRLDDRNTTHVFRTCGLPSAGAEGVTVAVPYRAGSGWAVARCLVRGAGTVELTRAQRSAAETIPDELVDALREERLRSPRPHSDPLPVDPNPTRTVDGKHALTLMRARCAQLVHGLASASYGPLAVYLHSLLMTIGVAFNGSVSPSWTVDAVQNALRDYATQRGWKPQDDAAWPLGLPRPESVPVAMVNALREGSPWIAGEGWVPPTEAERRQLQAELTPEIWDQVIAQTVEGRDEIKSQDVYDALHAAGLIGSVTPSAEQRGRISGHIEALGYEQSEKKSLLGRSRVWRRAAVESAATQA
jgi:hypothetical protein